MLSHNHIVFNDGVNQEISTNKISEVQFKLRLRYNKVTKYKQAQQMPLEFMSQCRNMRHTEHFEKVEAKVTARELHRAKKKAQRVFEAQNR
jgi:hypothetical protein